MVFKFRFDDTFTSNAHNNGKNPDNDIYNWNLVIINFLRYTQYNKYALY